MFIISGSVPGEYSYSGEDGSDYTISFIESLAKEVRKPAGKANWAALLDRASEGVEEDQEPQYMYIPF